MELRTFIAEYGRPGLMPMRHELRKHGRVDLEKAIALMGGPVKVAERMELSLAYKQRKPRGYWDELENISREVNISLYNALPVLLLLLFSEAAFSTLS